MGNTESSIDVIFLIFNFIVDIATIFLGGLDAVYNYPAN